MGFIKWGSVASHMSAAWVIRRKYAVKTRKKWKRCLVSNNTLALPKYKTNNNIFPERGTTGDAQATRTCSQKVNRSCLVHAINQILNTCNLSRIKHSGNALLTQTLSSQSTLAGGPAAYRHSCQYQLQRTSLPQLPTWSAATPTVTWTP